MRYSTLRKKLIKLQNTKSLDDFKRLLLHYIETYPNPLCMHSHVFIFWSKVIYEINYRRSIETYFYHVSISEKCLKYEYHRILNLFNYTNLNKFYIEFHEYRLDSYMRKWMRKYKKERYKKEIYDIFNNVFPSEIVETIWGFL